MKFLLKILIFFISFFFGFIYSLNDFVYLYICSSNTKSSVGSHLTATTFIGVSLYRSFISSNARSQLLRKGKSYLTIYLNFLLKVFLNSTISGNLVNSSYLFMVYIHYLLLFFSCFIYHLRIYSGYGK